MRSMQIMGNRFGALVAILLAAIAIFPPVASAHFGADDGHVGGGLSAPVMLAAVGAIVFALYLAYREKAEERGAKARGGRRRVQPRV